jgi:hypothetical protein
MRERKGWEWVQCGDSGYWSRVEKEGEHKHKLDFFCPHCKRPTGTICDKYLQEYGICSVCYVMYVEERKVPAIDLSKYKK